MNLPLLSSITTVIGKTIDDKFKELFKPTSLAAAGLFVVLNLALVFPPLVDAGWFVISDIYDLPMLWQVILLSILIPFLGFILNSFSSYFIDLVSLIAVQDAWIGRLLNIKGKVKRWQNEYDKLISSYKKFYDFIDKNDDQVIAEPNLVDKAGLEATAGKNLRRLAFEFPPPENIAPTKLGNVIASATSYSYDQYGAHFSTLWPAMSLLLQAKDNELNDRINQNFELLGFLVTLIIILGVVSIEMVLIGLFPGPVWLMLWIAPFYFLGWVIYGAAIQKALDWGRDIRASFDLHLDEVGALYHLREIKEYNEFSNKREIWEKVSQWLCYGALSHGVLIHKKAMFPGLDLPEQIPGWYLKKPDEQSYTPSLTYPSTIQVQPYIAENEVWEKMVVPDTNRSKARLAGRKIDYLFIITNADRGPHAGFVQKSFLLVVDKRISSVPDMVTDQAGKISGKRQTGATGKPDGLLWDLPGIPARSSLVLQYSIDAAVQIDLISNNAEIVSINQRLDGLATLTFTRTDKQAGEIHLEITAVNLDQLPEDAIYSFGTGGEGSRKLARKSSVPAVKTLIVPSFPENTLLYLNLWFDRVGS